MLTSTPAGRQAGRQTGSSTANPARHAGRENASENRRQTTDACHDKDRVPLGHTKNVSNFLVRLELRNLPDADRIPLALLNNIRCAEAPLSWNVLGLNPGGCRKQIVLR